MNEILTERQVLLDLAADTREDVFRAIAASAQELGITDSADALFDGFVQREREVTTGLMDGYAIPHTKTEAACRAALYYVRVARPLAWETMDGEPVRNVFALIAPARDQNDTHLMMLSALATCLLEEEFKHAVAHAQTAQDVVSLVIERIEKEDE